MIVDHPVRTHRLCHRCITFFVCRQQSRERGCASEQDGREVFLNRVTWLLLDPRRPYRGRFSEGSRLLVLKVPRFELGLSLLGETHATS